MKKNYVMTKPTILKHSDCLKLDFPNQLKIKSNTDQVNRFLVVARAVWDEVPGAVDRHILCDTPAFAHTWLMSCQAKLAALKQGKHGKDLAAPLHVAARGSRSAAAQALKEALWCSNSAAQGDCWASQSTAIPTTDSPKDHTNTYSEALNRALSAEWHVC